MNAPMPNPAPLSKMAQPLSIGNIVNVGIQLYRNNAKSYIDIALRATLWILAPILVGLVGSVILLALQASPGIIVVLIVACVALLFYALANYLGQSALITRMAFTTLLDQPETSTEAGRHTTQRKWQFFWLGILLGLLTFGILMGLFIVFGILMAIAAGVAGVVTTSGSAVGTGIVIILTILLYLGMILIFAWLGLRLYLIAEAPLAIEPEMTPGGAIGRSWSLTQGSFWRLFWVWSVLALIMLPVQVIQQVISATLQGFLAIVTDPLSNAFAALTFFVALAVGFAIGILILPLWQSVKATLYYDLRSRREGLALSVPSEPIDTAGQRDRPPTMSSTSPLRWLKTIEVVTPEQVGLQFTLAGIGGRGYAMAIDVAILLGVWTAAATLYSIFAIQLLNGLSNTNITYGQLPIWLGAIALLATFILFSGYFVFFEVTWQGQTPGKRAANIRVIRDDGRPIGLAQAVLRSLLLSFDGIPFFLGVIFILFEKREKRLGDIVAGTLVVQEEKPIAKANVTLSDRANTLAQDLPQSANLSLLLPDDFATIREYLERRSRMDRDARRELSLNLARQMRSRIEMESIPTGLTSDEFLEAVYIAYQKQFGGV